MARSYFHEFASTHDDLVYVSVKNHLHGSMNADAHISYEVSFEKAAGGFMVADLLTLYDCRPTSDGASCVVLAAPLPTSSPTRRQYQRCRSSLSPQPGIARPTKHHTVEGDQVASAKAYGMAGLKPRQIDVAEVHDCFTIAEVLATEDLGFAQRGEGGRFAREGEGQINEGTTTVNSSGGLKSKGHPLGATGTGQVVEVFKQLRGQVELGAANTDAETALDTSMLVVRVRHVPFTSLGGTVDERRSLDGVFASSRSLLHGCSIAVCSPRSACFWS